MRTAKSILIVGAGHMGSALAVGLKRASPDSMITLVEPDPDRRNEMNGVGIATIENLPTPITSAVVILAIPPQAFSKFSESTPQFEHYCGMVVSAMAGIELSELTARLKTPQVCRAMPNLPCSVNEGATALTFTTQTTHKNKLLVNTLFSTLGILLPLEEEKLFDEATALIGGGPAYTSYFAQALFEYALWVGFDKTTSMSMVLEILQGTAALLKKSNDSPLSLYKKVMTPEGTTERAINFFNHKCLQTTVIDGLKHSCARSKELGRRT